MSSFKVVQVVICQLIDLIPGILLVTQFLVGSGVNRILNVVASWVVV